ncbi:MAG: hypothetical protein HQL97_09045 [Magnetococcales bacterium]|nr:hypothetical protein [Magnetococcales bacterium]
MNFHATPLTGPLFPQGGKCLRPVVKSRWGAWSGGGIPKARVRDGEASLPIPSAYFN